MSNMLPPDDFGAYWDALDAELARYAAAPELDLLPLRCTDFARFYALRLTSIGPYRIFGYYSVPIGAGPFPGLLITPRYGSVNNPPHYDDRARYATLVLMHRGQRLADQPFTAAYPGLELGHAAITFSAASSGRVWRSPVARRLISTTPSATPLGPTISCQGTPTRSSEANLAPGRSSRSSRRGSLPKSASAL